MHGEVVMGRHGHGCLRSWSCGCLEPWLGSARHHLHCPALAPRKQTGVGQEGWGIPSLVIKN